MLRQEQFPRYIDNKHAVCINEPSGDGTIPVFDGTTGNQLRGSLVSIDDLGNITTSGTIFADSVNMGSAGVQSQTFNVDTINSYTTNAGVNVSGVNFNNIPDSNAKKITCLNGLIVDTGSETCTIEKLSVSSVITSKDFGLIAGNITVIGSTLTFGGAMTVNSSITGVTLLSSAIIKADLLQSTTNDTLLSLDTLGESIVYSSLTTVGSLVAGSISGNFGSIDIGPNTIRCGTLTCQSALNAISATIHAVPANSTTTKVDTLTIGSGDINEVGGNYGVLSLRGHNTTGVGHIISGWDIATGNVYNGTDINTLTFSDGQTRLTLTASDCNIYNTLNVRADMKLSYNKASSGVLPTTYAIVAGDCSANNIDYSLPVITDIGKVITIVCEKTSSTNNITITPYYGETINGLYSSITVSGLGSSVTIYTNNLGKWCILAYSGNVRLYS